MKLEKIDRALLRTEAIREWHIPELAELWRCRYRKMVEACDYLPRAWLDDASMVAQFIEQRAGNGVVVTFDNTVIGYMTFDAFDFHGEPTAFFPIMAHAAHEAYKLVAYSEMYTLLSQVLVDKGCLNHVVAFFAPDRRLQDYLYELGFGLYVVDSYRGLQPVPVGMASQDSEVRKASREDIDQLAALVKESDDYYLQAPLFLTREAEGQDIILDMVAADDQAVFIAVRDNTLVGFMNVRGRGEADAIILSDSTTALIDPLGAYIKKDYRGAGIGQRLLHEVVAWSSRQGIAAVHVDFESANYYANQFWPRYFTPIIYSVKRRLNSDVRAHVHDG